MRNLHITFRPASQACGAEASTITARARRSVLALGVAALALFGQAHAGTATFSGVSLGAAGPDNLNLGIFVTGRSTFRVSGSDTLFDTNLGLAARSGTWVTGNATLTGNLYKDPKAHLQNNLAGHLVVNGSILTQSLATALSDVQQAASNAASLAANMTVGSIGGSAYTIDDSSGVANGAGGKDTVVKARSIRINGPDDTLTIEGSANDWFIINVGSIRVANGAIVLAGGIDASHVLFNITGRRDSFDVSGRNAVLYGTYLAPKRHSEISLTGGTVNGAIIAYEIRALRGLTVNGSPYVAVPVPAAALLFGSALGLLGMAKRKGQTE